ncbi:MAG: hypothetical protein ABIU87_01045 [Ornithinibacter sp.]
MIVLGVILVLIAAAVGLGLIAAMVQLTPSVELDVPGGTLSLPPVAVLVTGMVIVAVFWLGWVMLRSGVRRSRRQRADAKASAREAEQARVEKEQRTKEEFAARERQLVEERRRHEEERAALLKEADARAAAGSAPSSTSSDAFPDRSREPRVGSEEESAATPAESTRRETPTT